MKWAMRNRKLQSWLQCGLVSLLFAGCGGTEQDMMSRPRSDTKATASLPNLEQRGFCNNSASCWSSCSSIAGPGNTAGKNCAASGADIAAGTAPLINTTFTYPVTAPDATANTGHVWMGNDANGGFANAYWFTQLGSNYATDITSFTYSTDLFVGNADGTYRAVEWDGNWFFGGRHFIFGLQNERNAVNVWRYFTPSSGWQSTGVPSTNLSGGWHHVTATFTVAGNTAQLSSFQVDGGAVHSGNGAWTIPSEATSSNKATFGVQGDELNTGMSLYYRNVNVSFH
jgi:hypothetical protein